jgi:hypothetical protein
MFVLQEDNVPSWARGLAGGLGALGESLRTQNEQQGFSKAFNNLNLYEPIGPQLGALSSALLKSGVPQQNVLAYTNALLKREQDLEELRGKQSANQGKANLDRMEQQLIAKHAAGQPLSQEEWEQLSPTTARSLLAQKTSRENTQERIKANEEKVKQSGEASNELYKNFVLPELKKKFPDRQWPQEIPSGASTTEIRHVMGLAGPEYEKNYDKILAKENAEYVKGIEDSYEGLFRQRANLARLKELTLSGDLSTPTMVATLNALGIPIEVLGNANNEEVEKISADMLGGISKIFPGRILQSEITMFLKSLPRLMQTKEGRLRIIRNMEVLAEAAELKYNALEKARQGKGAPPRNVRQLVNEETKEPLQELQQKFSRGLRLKKKEPGVTADNSSMAQQNPPSFNSPRQTTAPRTPQQPPTPMDLAQERATKPSTPQQSESTANQPVERRDEVDDEYYLPEDEQESWPKYLGRNALRTASRIGETVVGMPGNLQSLLGSGISAGAEYLANQELPLLRQVLGVEELPPEKQAKLKEANIDYNRGTLPTSSDIRKTMDKWTGGATEPRNNQERVADEFFENFAALASPGGIVKGGVTKLAGKAGIAAAGQGAKEYVTKLLDSEGAGEATRLAVMTGLSMFNPGGAQAFVSELYKNAEKTVPKNALVASKNLKSSLQSLYNNLLPGVKTPDKEAVMRPIRELLNKLGKPNIAMKEILNARRDVNSLISDPQTQHGARKLLSNVAGALNNTITEYGEHNPQFLKQFRAADKAYAATREGAKAQKMMAKATKFYMPESDIGKAIALMHHPGVYLGTKAVTGGLGAQAAWWNQIVQSPALRKYYGQVMLAATGNNTGALVSALKRFDRAALKRKQDQEFEFDFEED